MRKAYLMVVLTVANGLNPLVVSATAQQSVAAETRVYAHERKLKQAQTPVAVYPVLLLPANQRRAKVGKIVSGFVYDGENNLRYINMLPVAESVNNPRFIFVQPLYFRKVKY